ncbi:MAG: alpha/beta hydrolase [Methylicorpusculum sp.]|uniref:alpha/beta hydrolase n=1 Tax=Methylicorpusculum sp. TaxID=2713644 RepID=UPI002724C963|nr:alpha/beta hydrolase [Methylicorpusculum sp.]MDO8938423.1 alpha/beta hydrolase [Methylicorpusculum sp.]MDP2200969.1 alpha/beta hydrolase [Methylicorpusculum sp.]
MATVYFATNRNPNHAQTPTDFGKGFSDTGLGDLRFGQADVNKGKLDPKSIQILPDNASQGSEALFDELRQRMKADSVDSLIFIHGFNVSFKAAVESAAKMGERYLKISGNAYQPNIFVFSWPSDGKITRYFNDRHDAEASGYAFARGLMKLSGFLHGAPKKEACQQKINLIAHSMGNYVLRHALQQAQKIANGESLSRIFDNIVLTAADEDNDTFEFDHKLARLPDLAQRITVYFNSGDLALKTSDHTKGNPDRLGHDGPNKPHQVPAKVVLVDVSGVVKGISEHSYHVDDNKVAKDIVAVLKGESSENIPSRIYVQHANKFKLV